ncbi:hypothetical protein TNCV_4687701 [Trichonephila clavipes]|nr:hypothetical protein TNCV_4687701 [Trichonephila clavipes]
MGHLKAQVEILLNMLRMFCDKTEKPSKTSSNCTELWRALANTWQVISVESVQKLVKSMPRPVATVIKAR